MAGDNPYRVLGADVPSLLGRAETIQKIEAHLDKPEADHVSVVGPAMYGKSVLLQEIARRYAGGRSGFITSVLVDMRHRTPQTDEKFRELIAAALRQGLSQVRPELAEYFDLEGVRLKERLQAVVQELAASGDRMLLVLDGFDDVLANPGITRTIWDNLRSLARQPVVRYVTGSRRPLRELCRTEESRTSDLWEIFTDAPVAVGCFAAEDWGSLLEPFADDEIERGSREALVAWTAGVPVLAAALLHSLFEGVEAGVTVTKEEVDRQAEALVVDRRDLLDALWEDCSAEMKADLADLADRELRVSQVPEGRLRELELRGLVQREGKKIRSACRLMQQFAAGEAAEVNSLQRLFGEHAQFEHNVRALLEMRLRQLTPVDAALHGYVEQAVRHIHPEPRHSVVWVRSIVDRALDLVWGKELKDGTTIPDAWIEEWERAGIRNRPDDGTGRLPAERGKQMRLLRYATGTGIRGQSLRRVTRHVTRPTALLVEHLQSVGNFGQHQDDTIERPFAVAVCMAAIALCYHLGRDLGGAETR